MAKSSTTFTNRQNNTENTTLASIETIDNQVEIVSKEIARYAWQDSQDVKILS